MKFSTAAIFLSGICAGMAQAQFDIPDNPLVHPNRPARSVGGNIHPGATVEPPKLPNVRHITHIVLYDYRMWSNTEGKPLEAKLIAFEDLVVEVPAGAVEPSIPSPPAHPTVEKGGKIRLLVNGKAVEVALEKLSLSDREFIAQMKAALAKKAAAGK